jgi:hypothetical protein
MLRPGGIFAVAVAILLVGLTPIAYAVPPDPTYIGGYWDDDDFDTVRDFITTVSALPAPAVIDAGALWLSDDRAEPTQRDARLASPPTSARPRAPPLSLSLGS